MYLAIVMGFVFTPNVDWHIDKRVETNLLSKALIKAYNLRHPPSRLVFHSVAGSQYTSL